MAVYTQLSKSDIDNFLAAYNVGKLQSFKGIAEGVSNTNYLIATIPPISPLPQGGREVQGESSFAATNYILTLFERSGEARDLPFFMALTGHLADKGIVCPRPVENNMGAVIGDIKGVPAVLVEFLPGRGNPHITPRHLELVGDMVGKLHLAAADFPQSRVNNLSLSGFHELFDSFHKRADEIAPGLAGEIGNELAYLDKNFPDALPSGVVHTDIFPDNVFFIDGNTDQPELSGIIDFYFSCNDFWMYDLMIVLNAWCFDAAHQFVPRRAQALLGAYNKIRPMTGAEKKEAQVLARAASMRFLLTRCFDWLNRVDGALVNIKDPMEYVKKLRFHQMNNPVMELLDH